MVSDGQLANRLVPWKDPRERNIKASMVSTFQGPGEQGLWEQGLWSPTRLRGNNKISPLTLSSNSSQFQDLFQISASYSSVGFRAGTPCGGVFIPVSKVRL